MRCWVLLAALAIWPELLSATSFISRPFPDVVRDTPVIVRGKVGMVYSDFAKSGTSRKIYTFYELTVDEVLKGQAGKSIVMKQLGGTKEGTTLSIEGSASFQRGEEVVVLLTNKSPDGTFDVRGLMMGKLNLIRDREGREGHEGKDVLAGPAIPLPGEEGGIVHDHHDGDFNDADPSPAGTPGSGERWTLESLRTLIANQSSSVGALTAPGGRAAAPTPRASPLIVSLWGKANAPQGGTSEVVSQPASGEMEKVRGIERFRMILLVGSVVGAIAWVLLRKR